MLPAFYFNGKNKKILDFDMDLQLIFKGKNMKFQEVGLMTIKEVSKKYDISADTLRYYERIGLLPNIGRTSGGIRNYKEEDCNWVSYIKCMRSAGISIETLIEYVRLFNMGKSTIGARKELLIEQRNKIADKIEELTQTLHNLDWKIEGYEERMVKLEESLIYNEEKNLAKKLS